MTSTPSVIASCLSAAGVAGSSLVARGSVSDEGSGVSVAATCDLHLENRVLSRYDCRLLHFALLLSSLLSSADSLTA